MIVGVVGFSIVAITIVCIAIIIVRGFVVKKDDYDELGG